MRFRTVALVLGLAVLSLSLVLLYGCSSDDSNPTTSNFGSNSNPEFQAVQEQIDYFVDSTLYFVRQGFVSLQHVSPDDDIDDILYGPGEPGDIESITYDQVSGWHKVVISRERTTYSTTLVDSIQFRNAAGEPQEVSTDCASLTFKHYWTYSVNDQSATYTNFEGGAIYTFDGVNTTAATVAGTHNFMIEDVYVANDSTVRRDFNFDADVADILIYQGVSGEWDQWCPSDGTLDCDLDMTYTKDDATPAVSEWTVDVVFDAGNMDATVVRGTTTWNYDTQLCTPPAGE
jgi:hypothetical protein